jgi:FlaG/FlaF family flagellin (archaellin)
MASQRKGVSPLVAVVALIGITLIISGILTSYATRFTSTKLSQLQECSDAGVIIQGARYESGTEELFLYVKNRGNMDLAFDVIFTKDDSVITQDPGTYDTAAGQLNTFTVTNVTSNLKEVTIQSQECPGVQDTMQKYWITGM